jgi:hypothetical protein
MAGAWPVKNADSLSTLPLSLTPLDFCEYDNRYQEIPGPGMGIDCHFRPW